MSNVASHTKKLGWFLCWAVVFADIGTSVYYVPGILYGEVNRLAGLFVTLTSLVFVLLSMKYIEITDRYPEGGGVVTVATHAFGPWFGALGGMFITVDYFLTAAISAVSGFDYLSSLFHIAPYIVILSAIGLIILGCLNIIGIKESAGVTAVIAVAAFVVDFLLVLFVMFQIRPEGWHYIFDSYLHISKLSPWQMVTGFAGSFLAFSGLESISQLSPAMAVPRKKIAGIAMTIVIATILVTSPLLTLFSTNILTAKAQGSNETILESVSLVSQRQEEIKTIKDPQKRVVLQKKIDQGILYSGQFISELGAQYGGSGMKIAVVLTASILLLFAANTAIIGAYHVFMALSRQNFLPHKLQTYNAKFGTPHWSIFLAVSVPIIIVFITNGNLDLLGELYAFGLLGAFGLSSTGLDIVRWKEGQRKNPMFLLGILTTVLVIVAWMTNLYSKQLATLFGGSITIVGMIIAYIIHTYFPHRAIAEKVILTPITKIKKGQLLLPLWDEYDPAVISFAERQAKHMKKSIVLIYIREFSDILQAVPDNVNLDEEAEKILYETYVRLEKQHINTYALYTTSLDAGKTINDYRKKILPSTTILSSHKRIPLVEFIKGDTIAKVFGYKNGEVLLYTGGKHT